MDQQEKLASRVSALKEDLKKIEWQGLAVKTGARPDPDGNLIVKFLGEDILVQQDTRKITFADSGVECPAFFQAIILFYLTHASGVPMTGNWIRFRDLPEGMHYDQAFQGYTGNRLALEIGNDLESLQKACLAMGGQQYDLGDLAFAFKVLPRFAILLVCWRGDDEFPPSYQMLFDESASAYMPTDGCAILGNVLAGKIISSTKS